MRLCHYLAPCSLLVWALGGWAGLPCHCPPPRAQQGPGHSWMGRALKAQAWTPPETLLSSSSLRTLPWDPAGPPHGTSSATSPGSSQWPWPSSHLPSGAVSGPRPCPSLQALGHRRQDSPPWPAGPPANHCIGYSEQTLPPLHGPPGDRTRSQEWRGGPIGRLSPPPHHRHRRPREQPQGPTLMSELQAPSCLPREPPEDGPTHRATVTPKQHPKCQSMQALLGGSPSSALFASHATPSPPPLPIPPPSV